ncbi:helix-turn-helix domain-containing protein [Sunxiuqinia dokdonensis]|uniref:Transcriptional regulator n=1 Tax=Sunxiuqinia dokdonensis TaxID=1409788 RepID=A0A0L8V330_9BACT|nr:helix-turn-helix domain-containing protein [Sunxiuqinia dokdonensis]KOH42841.1 transcriptional regulator [Sunxiuqinia dokdonensis]
MASEILTTDDLREFKIELLEELKQLLQENQGLPEKKWLRSGEVRKLLNISQGTLQNMRVNGTLPFSKMGGLLYYKSQDIDKILESNKSQSLIRFGNR